MELICATSNEVKFGTARAVLAQYGITLKRIEADITEIQSDEPEVIIRDKAEKAYAVFGQPVVVTDDSWEIPALGGFPGAYMKSINHWFTPDDFIRLLQGVNDRRIFLHKYVAYHDGTTITTFHSTQHGQVATAPRGKFGPPAMHVAELSADQGKTISEAYDEGMHNEERYADSADAWHQLAEFLSGHPSR